MAQGDMLATVLEEMPPFPERESSILAKLKKKKPAAARVIEEQATEEKKTPKAAPGMVIISHFYWENYFLLLFFFCHPSDRVITSPSTCYGSGSATSASSKFYRSSCRCLRWSIRTSTSPCRTTYPSNWW